MQSPLPGTWLVTLALTCPGYVVSICDPDIPSRPLPTPSPSPLTARLRSRHSSQRCEAGKYLDKSAGSSCKSCPQGQFMTELMSSMGYQTCETCQQANPDEILVQNCTATTDSTILCKPDRFRTLISHKPEKHCYWECRFCSVCGVGTHQFSDFETEPCSYYNDTVCCPRPGMNVLQGRCVDATTTVKLVNAPGPITKASGEELQAKRMEAISTPANLALGTKNSVDLKLMFLVALIVILSCML